MNFEAILNYFTHHVEAIIQWLFLGILALTGFLISRGLLTGKVGGAATEDSGAPAPGELKGVLDQILERTSKLEAVTVKEMSPEVAALAETQVEGLKKELAVRDEEIKALKTSSASTPAVSEEATKLGARVKELEAKLAEYEILEDDIADLSLFKEENQRLRSEVEKLRGGGSLQASAPAPEPEPAAEPETAPVESTDDIVAEFAEAVNQETGAEPAPTVEVPDTGNPMSDFEAAVKAERAMTGDKIPEVPKPKAAPAAAPAAAAGADESDDLFAEFSESPKAVAEGDLDTDKMMAEMAALVSLEPATGNALEESVDTEKMVAEAKSLPKR